MFVTKSCVKFYKRMRKRLANNNNTLIKFQNDKTTITTINIVCYLETTKRNENVTISDFGITKAYQDLNTNIN